VSCLDEDREVIENLPNTSCEIQRRTQKTEIKFYPRKTNKRKKKRRRVYHKDRVY
jgi:hypothetical protein